MNMNKPTFLKVPHARQKNIDIFTIEHILSEQNMIVYLLPIQRIALIFFIC